MPKEGSSRSADSQGNLPGRGKCCGEYSRQHNVLQGESPARHVSCLKSGSPRQPWKYYFCPDLPRRLSGGLRATTRVGRSGLRPLKRRSKAHRQRKAYGKSVKTGHSDRPRRVFRIEKLCGTGTNLSRFPQLSFATHRLLGPRSSLLSLSFSWTNRERRFSLRPLHSEESWTSSRHTSRRLPHSS